MGQLAQVFRSLNNNPTNVIRRHLPMINSLSTSYSSYLTEFGQVRKKKQLMNWYRRTPELTALASKVARDIVWKWHFEPAKYNESGRNKILSANKFSQQVQLQSLMLSQAIDVLVTGEGFGWLGRIKNADEVVRKELQRIVKSRSISLKEKNGLFDSIYSEIKESNGMMDTVSGMDEDILRPRKYRYMASTSVEIVYDQYDILHYNHFVGTLQEKFMPEEIVHYKFIDVDGKVNGFTPIESVVVQLELLRQMWQNMIAVHRNGGAPDYMFILKNVQPNTPAYKLVEQQLEKYKLVENKHGNMLFTGDVGIEELQQLDKMQFMDSGLYITGLMAMQWQVPRSSIPFILKDSKTEEGVGSNAERGYWQNIQFAQDVFSDTMNNQLWIPYFGVKIVFDNQYIQHDMQYQTARMQRLSNLQTETQLLSQIGKKITPEVLMKELGRSDLELEEAPVVDPMQQDMVGGIGTSAQMSNTDANSTQHKKDLNTRKRVEQEMSIASSGRKPSGVGKERDTKDSIMLEYKQVSVSPDLLNLGVKTFVKVYLEEVGKNADPPRIFMSRSSDIISLKFKSPSDFVYTTNITTFDLDKYRVLLMNLGYKIYDISEV